MQWGKLKTWFARQQLLWMQAKQVRQPDLVVTLDNKPLACALALHLLEGSALVLGYRKPCRRQEITVPI